MVKKYGSTFFGISLSVLIAIGGWVILCGLIQKSEESLFAKQGTSTDKTLDITSNPTIEPFDISHIAYIIRLWEDAGDVWPHEPTSGQINIEDAIQIAKDGLSFVNLKDILPTEFYKSAITKATLYEKEVYDSNDARIESSPEQDYWEVILSNDYETASKITVTFKINAVTGRIWTMGIETFFDNGNDTQANDLTDSVKMLNCFTSYLNIGTGVIKQEENRAVLSYDGGELFAVASRQVNHSDNGKTYFSISLRLSTISN